MASPSIIFEYNSYQEGAMNRFGEWLRDARKRGRLTQKKLAEKVGVHFTYISKMEKGLFLPAREVALKLADALGISGKVRRFLFFLEAKVASSEDMEGLTLVEVDGGRARGGVQLLRRRRSGALASPPIDEPSPVSASVEATTVGQDIDEVLKELSQEERNMLREILVPLARRLGRLIKLVRGG
jgi:transcriptional regulator with XRE-family HTH domain